MAKFLVLICVLVIFGVFTEAAVRGDCPLSSQTTTCTPKCLNDFDCSSTGTVCCPNLCNTKSCVRAKAGSAGSSSGNYKGSSQTTATGVYCGNVKCSAYEKCELDKATKRQKCVRT